MRRKTGRDVSGSGGSERKEVLEDIVMELEALLLDAGVFDLFEEPQMISMRLPNRPHPVACSFLSLPDCGPWIIFDLQIGGLSSRALAITGHTTHEEADAIGTTLSLAPPVELDGLEELHGSQRDIVEDFVHQQEGSVLSTGRHPGKAPHDPDLEELETLGFAFHGLLAAFHASALTPCDIRELPKRILEICVSGDSGGLVAADDLKVTWDHVPFDPILMATFPSARVDRTLRRRPLRGKHSWILHMIPMNISFGPQRETMETLFAVDARSGMIVSQGSTTEGTAEAIGQCLHEIIHEAGFRPGSAITTSPRLDEILGEALQGLGIRYVMRKRMRASDSRIQALEEFMRWAKPNIAANMLADSHEPGQ